MQFDVVGMLIKFSCVKLGEKNEFGVVEGNDFGFKVSGILIEWISFSFLIGEVAVYLIGILGFNDMVGGQFVKLIDLVSGDLIVGVFLCWEVDVIMSEVDVVGGEDGEIWIKIESNLFEIYVSVVFVDGGIYVVGEIFYMVDGQVIKGEQDFVFVKYDSFGNKFWSCVLGVLEDVVGMIINVDDDGNVVIVGQVFGGFGFMIDIGGMDMVVVKYNGDGVEQWMQCFGSCDDDIVDSVVIGLDGMVYVVGCSELIFGDQIYLGGVLDGYICVIGFDGIIQYICCIGGVGEDKIVFLVIVDDGSLLVVSEEDGVGVVCKYDVVDGMFVVSWEQSLGDLEDGWIGQIISDGMDIYVVGFVGFSFVLSVFLSGYVGGVCDVFLVKMIDGVILSLNYMIFVGLVGDEMVNVVIVSDGKVYLVGKMDGILFGVILNGDCDVFVVWVDVIMGVLDWVI